MASLNAQIAALEARIAKYESDLDAAVTPEEKDQLRRLIMFKEERLADLLKQKRGAMLGDGFPKLEKNLTVSSPYVPTEAQHASCRRVTMDLPLVPSVTNDVLSATNSVWRATAGEESLLYSSEADIAGAVKIYLTDIILALNLKIKFSGEVTIQQVRPDICALLMGRYLVGVVEVKKPGNNVMLEPTVLGELLDQMLLVEGFYGMGPVIGILTTAEEWIVSWFPVDTDALSHLLEESPEASFTTPVKPTASKSEPKGYSPPGGTPSQKSGLLHCIETDAADAEEDGTMIVEEMERCLCATEVMNIFTNPVRVLEVLSCAFQLMAKSRSYRYSTLPRCLLKFHKDIKSVTFHPASYESVYSSVDFNKFPNRNVKTLIALEDLGRGSTGKAWLCVTVTKPHSAVCVLKFPNGSSNKTDLTYERDMWHLIYPEFSHMIKLEHWSGSDALVMPHFSLVLESERESYRTELFDVLVNKFGKLGKVHNDVRWRNIGKCRNRHGSVSLVVYDLHSVQDYNAERHSHWIEDAIAKLYADV